MIAKVKLTIEMDGMVYTVDDHAEIADAPGGGQVAVMATGRSYGAAWNPEDAIKRALVDAGGSWKKHKDGT